MTERETTAAALSTGIQRVVTLEKEVKEQRQYCLLGELRPTTPKVPLRRHTKGSAAYRRPPGAQGGPQGSTPTSGATPTVGDYLDGRRLARRFGGLPDMSGACLKGRGLPDMSGACLTCRMSVTWVGCL